MGFNSGFKGLNKQVSLNYSFKLLNNNNNVWKIRAVCSYFWTYRERGVSAPCIFKPQQNPVALSPYGSFLKTNSSRNSLDLRGDKDTTLSVDYSQAFRWLKLSRLKTIGVGGLKSGELWVTELTPSLHLSDEKKNTEEIPHQSHSVRNSNFPVIRVKNSFQLLYWSAWQQQ